MVDFHRMLWDERFMRIAISVAGWSKDPSTRVGCVLVRNKKIVATGYNGFPAGIMDDDRLKDREEKYMLIIHAEMNALLQAGHNARGTTLYLAGMPCCPCQNCTKHIIQAGIVRIVHRRGIVKPHWQDEVVRSRNTLLEAGITITECGREKNV